MPYPMLEVFDMASSQQVHSKRDITTTSPQALTLINSDLYYEWSQTLAGKVIREAGTDFQAQLNRLYEILFGRTPDGWEKDALQNVLVQPGKNRCRTKIGRQNHCRPGWIQRDPGIERHAGRGFCGYGARAGEFKRVHVQVLTGFQ